MCCTYSNVEPLVDVGKIDFHSPQYKTENVVQEIEIARLRATQAAGEDVHS